MPTIDTGLLQKLASATTILLLTAVIAWLLANFLGKMFARLAQRSQTELDNLLLDAIKKPLIVFVSLAGIWFALQQADFLIAPDSPTLGSTFFILYLILGVVVAVRLVTSFIDWYSREIAKRTVTRLDDHFLPFFRRLVVILVAVIAGIILLGHFNVNVSALVTTLGIGSLAVALAAQEVLSNMISGFIILVDRPFRIGDRIELEELETWGDVKDISLHSTRILTRDNRMVSIPNALIGKNRVVNHSFPSTQYRVQTHIGIAYGSDIEQARQIMIEAIRAQSWVMKNKPIEALFLEFQDSGLLFRVRCWIEHYIETRRIIDKMNTTLYQALNQADIEIPFPQRVVHVYNGNAAENSG